MKNKRQNRIIEIIRELPVKSQEELRGLLSADGYIVTQATLSRDIKELKLIKSLTDDGGYRYILPENAAFEGSSRSGGIFSDTVRSVDYAKNMAVVKCHNGMAQAACAALDSMNFSEIVGTLAGDDTIFVLMRTESDAIRLVKALEKLL